MNLRNFLEELYRRKIVLWLENGQLRYEAPEGELTAGDLDKLKKHKADVMAFIREEDCICRTHPLTPGQEGLYFVWLTAPESAAYNIGFSLRIKSELDIDVVENSFQRLVERHSVLRSVFDISGDRPLQHIFGWQKVCFEVADAGEWNEEVLEQKVRESYQRPFDLEKGPLMRVHIFSRSYREHLLLLTIHHIISDFYSAAVLMDEFQNLYSTGIKRLEPYLPPLSRGYADYVQHQSQLLNTGKRKNLEAYWWRKLSGDPPLLNLPFDHPKPTRRSYNGASHRFEIGSETGRRLKDLANKKGATLFMLMMAAFQTLLHRYTGQDDVSVGFHTSPDRQSKEFGNTVGYLVNTLVLRADFSKDASFADFLRQTRRDILEAMEHGEYPFSWLVEKLNLWTPGSDPINCVFFLNTPLAAKELAEVSGDKEFGWGEMTVQAYDLDQQEGQLDIVLEVIDAGKELHGIIKYDTDLFEPETIERMAVNFQVLLEGIVDDPDQKIGRLPLLAEDDKRKLMLEWNDTKVEYPKDKCIHRLFEEQARKTPDKTAVVFPGTDLEHRAGAGQLTYAELDLRADRLARHLQSLGVGPEIPVGICMERSLDMVVGLMGILKSGGAYVPLDPSFPGERLKMMLEDSEAPVILSRSGLSDPLPEVDSKIVFLDEIGEKLEQDDLQPLLQRVESKNRAYIMFTSGSTGRPKGVQISHQNVVNFLNSMRREPGLDADDILAAVTTISFDISVLEIFLPLLTGAELVLLSREMSVDAYALRQVMEELSVTVMQATPATWRLLEESDWDGKRDLKVLCGGEPFPADLAEYLLERVGSVWNVYGPTETTIWSTVERITDAGNITIGHPIDNTEIYILDNRLVPVPIGVSGNLYIGGDGLSQGYLKRPELTAEKFIPDPFVQEEGRKIYDTGDSARHLPDGRTIHLGRTDKQVKLRGFRIELGEIEALLNSHPDVRQAVVVLREDQPGDKRLVAYLTAEVESVSVGELRDHLDENLPDYMVPSAFVILDAMPLTPNAKIDRKALPAPDMEAGRETAYVPPSEDLEKKIAEIWAEVLGMDQVGIHDNFFQIGGNSLLISRAFKRLEKLSEAKLKLVEMFKYPTIHSLARYIGRKSDAEHSRRSAAEGRKDRQTAMKQKRKKRQKRQ